MSFPYVFTETLCTVFVNGQMHSFSPDEVTEHEFAEIKRILDFGDESDLPKLLGLIQPSSVLERAVESIMASQGEMPSCVDIRFDGEQVTFNDLPIDNALTQQIIDIHRHGLDVSRWLAFAENVYANPLDSARQELFLWLQGAEMPITDDGHFLAWKRVRSDYKDCHTGTIDNSVGNIVEMDRSKVDTNRYNLCSSGLHFCSRSYLPHFSQGDGGKILILKINPADVVAIPNDYNNAKGRCWRYTVIGEVPNDEFVESARFRPMVSVGEESTVEVDQEWFADELAEGETVTIAEAPSEYVKRVADSIEVPQGKSALWDRIIKRLKGE